MDIISMAREAHRKLVTEDYPGHTGQLDPWTLRLCERFAAIVLEQAAKVCEEQAERSTACMQKTKSVKTRDIYYGAAQTARWNAAAIRALVASPKGE